MSRGPSPPTAAGLYQSSCSKPLRHFPRRPPCKLPFLHFHRASPRYKRCLGVEQTSAKAIRTISNPGRRRHAFTACRGLIVRFIIPSHQADHRQPVPPLSGSTGPDQVPGSLQTLCGVLPIQRGETRRSTVRAPLVVRNESTWLKGDIIIPPGVSVVSHYTPFEKICLF